MDLLPLKDRWPEWQQRMRREYPQLTDEDLRYEEGKEKELLQRLKEKLGKTEADIRDWLHLMG